MVLESGVPLAGVLAVEPAGADFLGVDGSATLLELAASVVCALEDAPATAAVAAAVAAEEVVAFSAVLDGSLVVDGRVLAAAVLDGSLVVVGRVLAAADLSTVVA